MRFDERFDFHFYDLDFCRTARQAGLSIGTWPIAMTHQSKGAFGSDGWIDGLARYRAKWKGAPVIVTECTRYDRPHGWTYRNGGPIAVTFDADLTPTPTGTALRVRFDASPQSIPCFRSSARLGHA